MAAALKGRPVLPFPHAAGRDHGAWHTATGTVTDAFKPRPGAGRVRSIPGERQSGVAADEPMAAAAPPTSCRRGRQQHGRAVLTRPSDGARFRPMSAESDALNEQIKQSIALLRRHL